MYNRHARTLGRGGPVTREMMRATDGIAASLRQFSSSASWGAEGGADGAPPPSRTERSQEAFKQVSSLARPTRGIDARSLAAKPPGSFTISRTPVDGPRQGPPGGARPQFQIQTNRDGARGPPRQNMRGGGAAGRGRGGAGRGGMASRGGRASAAATRRLNNRQRKEEEESMIEEPYNEEEKAYLKQSECGFESPYQPITSAEDLQLLATPTISSSQGLNSTLQYKLAVASGNPLGNYSHASKHLATMYKGTGLTFFEDPEQKGIAQAFAKQKKVEYNGMYAHRHGKHIESLNEETRTKLANVWIAGHYEKPVAPKTEGDVLGQVGNFLRRNETYLPEDVRKLEAKLGALLPPGQKAQSQPSV